MHTSLIPTSFDGLPLHPLIVHATVVVVPLAALFVLLAGIVPRFRRWAGFLPLALSVVSVVLVPLSTSSGDTLKKHLGNSPAIEKHEHLADGLLPWVIALLVISLIITFANLRKIDGRALLAGLALVAIVGAVGVTQQVVRIGHSGAEAAWGGVMNRNG